MIKNELERIAENYASIVEDALVCEHHMTPAEAAELVQASELRSCICGCPYIANHYPAAKAAAQLVKKSGRIALGSGHRKSAATSF